MTDQDFMLRAINLAEKGRGFTSPNPLVGAVIVKDGIIIGEGFHEKYGDLHAERNAIKDCIEKGNSPEGATIYVTLEPCAHFGKQPPCCHALVEHNIKEVFVGSRDPNPLVSGKGNTYLREHEIKVTEDFMREECDALNPVFFHFITTKTPYIVMKYAMSLDGRISMDSGESQWITNEESRNYVQILRSNYKGILCGINTVIKDDPLLTCRIPGRTSPVRIILDSHLKINTETNLVKTAKDVPLIVACLNTLPACQDEKISELEDQDVTVLKCLEKDGHIDLQDLMKKLGILQIDSVLIEGGGIVNAAFLKEGLGNRVYSFVGGKILGGNENKSPVQGEVCKAISESPAFELKDIKNFENDVLMVYDKF
ncbi:MAG: bifunctional diaminohydroxyphosphoribosylaminopyrimidine deaminase/5-amino-6-(5-phosphoribosylamino)uracil reductase RibD [Treponema sp.]|nr:bifunctional diaminohydroxyphosphoribosylaminopyrimidine deaminase/5-amino-6-(5-phosphoribosylamino)uracil reductase RibD [Treponema sp.]